MASLNKVILIGRLGKDPEVIDFENGNRKVTAILATTERYRDRNTENSEWREQTEWHNIVVHGNLANDIAEKRRNYAKGDMMYVEGKLRTRHYEKDGQTRRITEIVAEKMMLLTNPQRQQRNSASAFENEPNTSIDNFGDFSDLDANTDIENTINKDLPF